MFIDNNILWFNFIFFMFDNCSVMIGKNNLVVIRIKEKIFFVFDFGCVCYLVNFCVVVGVKVLVLFIEDFFIEVFFYFYYSFNRKEKYKEFLEFIDIEFIKILKYCSIRWFSLEKCVDRLLYYWLVF